MTATKEAKGGGGELWRISQKDSLFTIGNIQHFWVCSTARASECARVGEIQIDEEVVMEEEEAKMLRDDEDNIRRKRERERETRRHSVSWTNSMPIFV